MTRKTIMLSGCPMTWLMYQMPIISSVVLLAVVILSLRTGKTWMKSPEVITRQDSPAMFYFAIGTYAVLAFVFIGMHFFLSSLHHGCPVH